MVSLSAALRAAFGLTIPLQNDAQLPMRAPEYSASPYAGATTSAIFPPPDATNAASSLDTYFSDATQVGYHGATPTGDEAAILATAPAAPRLTDTYPLLVPSSLNESSSSSDSSDVSGNFDMLRYWGNLAPRFSVDSTDFGLPNASARVPEGCELQQVHLVHRHGARYPTDWDGPAVLATKVRNATVEGTGFTAKGDLEFLNAWSYKLGGELLTPFGRKQLFDLGVAFRMEYGELLKNFTGLPVFRTTSVERMVQSAQNFAAGFFGVPDYVTNYRQSITIEHDGFNNSLCPWNVCPNSNTEAIGYIGDGLAMKWAAVYLHDALLRLQAQVDGLSLTIQDVLNMQQTCAFETVALGSSAFCGLFTEEEWRGFEYYFDVLYWYDFGPGNPTAAAQGIGYVQELLSRLTQTPITAHNSSTNATLDDNSVTFPLYQPIFVDATHDTLITAGKFHGGFELYDPESGWATSGGPYPYRPDILRNHVAPFAATLTGQVLSCPSRDTDTSLSDSDNALYMRWMLNDGVIPQTGVAGCGADVDGLCLLDTYISALQTRLGEVDFAFDCHGNYTVPNPDTVTDGRPPADQRP